MTPEEQAVVNAAITVAVMIGENQRQLDVAQRKLVDAVLVLRPELREVVSAP